jgi:twitching motility protein PilT
VERSALKIELMLEQVIKFDASDLHVQVGLPPMLRVDGGLRPIEDSPVLDAADVEKLVFSILDDDQKEILLKDKEVDFSFAFGNYGRFRVNAFHERGNVAAALRLIPSKVRTLEELDMPKVLQDFTKFPRGLVLVTGPTGSGKSTTLAAMVDKINTERSCHILTIEDPIEYAHNSKKSIVVQREIHYDTYSFAAALRSSLRQDPDVVLIGEMRDLETISAAVTIAETGHLVLATLHTNSAAQSIDRMIDVFPPHQQQQIRVQLAGMLQGIVRSGWSRVLAAGEWWPRKFWWRPARCATLSGRARRTSSTPSSRRAPTSVCRVWTASWWRSFKVVKFPMMKLRTLRSTSKSLID